MTYQNIFRRMLKTDRSTTAAQSGVRRLGRNLIIAGALLAGSTVAATAQTFAFPNGFTNLMGGSVSRTVTGLPTGTTSDATIDVTLSGDLNDAGEIVTVFVDGVNVGSTTPTGGPACVGFATSFTVPQATLAPLILDGELIIEFQAAAIVSPVCVGDSLAVTNGSITYTGGTPPPPPPPTASNTTVSQHLAFRSRSLAQNQPDVLRFVDGRTAGNFNADVTRGSGIIDFATAARGPLWVSLSGSKSDSTGVDHSYFLGSVGGHLSFGANTIIGGMLQFDRADNDITGGDSIEGTGWLVGPYFATQVSDQPLFLDGRILYGETDNDITPAGNPTDNFDGERWLVSLNLEGRVNMEGYTLFPRFEISHVRDKQNAYTDSGSNLIAAQEVELTEANIGLNFERPLNSNGLTLTGGASAIWSDFSGSGGSAAVIGSGEDWRGRIDAGLNFAPANGPTAGVNLFFDGLGDDSYESYGLDARLTFNF